MKNHHSAALVLFFIIGAVLSLSTNEYGITQSIIVFVDVNIGKNQSDCTDRSFPCDSISNALLSVQYNDMINNSSGSVVRVVLLSNILNCKSSSIPFVNDLEIVGDYQMLKFQCSLTKVHTSNLLVANLTLFGDAIFDGLQTVVLRNVIVNGFTVVTAKYLSMAQLTLRSASQLFNSVTDTLKIRESHIYGRFSIINDELNYAKTFIEDTIFNNSIASVGLESKFHVSNNYRSLSVKSSYFSNSIFAVKDSATIAFSDCTFNGNYYSPGEIPLYLGNALYISSYSPAFLSVSNSVFKNNIAHGSIKLIGGGISSYFNNCTFSDNINFFGGAALFLENIYASVIENSFFINNQFQKLNISYAINDDEMGGGAIYQRQSILTTKNCVFINNRANEGLGGAILTTHSTIYNTDSDIFFNNTAGIGGALSTIDSSSLLTISMKNSTFEKNVAYKVGGAIFSFRCYSITALTHVYFIGNNANYGGAIYLASSSILGLRSLLIYRDNFEYGLGGERYLSNLRSFPKSFSLNVTDSVINEKMLNFNFGKQMELLLSYDSESLENMENNPIMVGIKVTGATTDFTNSLYKNKLKATFYSFTRKGNAFTFTVSFNFNLLKSFGYSISNTFTVEPSQCKPTYWYEMDKIAQVNSIDGYGCSFNWYSVLPFIFFGILFGSILVGAISLLGFVKIRKMRQKIQILDKKELAEVEINQRLIELEQLYTSEVESKYYIKDWMIKIEDIKILSKIGEGGMGVVYRGIFSLHEVALKTVKIDSEDLESNDFEREATILSSMRHPNIVGFYGVCITDSSRFMVTEFLSGGSLDALIYGCKKKQRYITLQTKISILLGIANGMSYLHSGKNDICVIHRDLKPANILLTNELVPKVCDFGLSRLSKDSGRTTKTTNIGTLMYIPPEMLLGKDYNQTVDVFSFSIIMWQLIFDETLLYNAAYVKNPKFSTFMSIEDLQIFVKLVDSSYIVIPKLVTEGLRLPIPKRPIDTVQLRNWVYEYFINDDSKFEMQQKDSFDIYVTALNGLFNLMEKCWQESTEGRPSFGQISKELLLIRNTFK